jgi:uncharacterized protein (TIGR04255 family)
MELPTKLKRDAIAEALFEIRFSHDSLSEAVCGRLLNADVWKTFRQVRLPLGEVPHQIRENDHALKYQPIFELCDETKTENKVRIGPNVLSFHVVGTYPGWEVFRKELHKMIHALLEHSNSIRVERLCLRYLNALNKQHHHISNIHELNIKLEVALQSPGEEIFLAYNRAKSDLMAVIRIATKSFVGGPLLTDANSFVDVEVFGNNNDNFQSCENVKDWTESAHIFEKECFFELLPAAVIEQLRDV